MLTAPLQFPRVATAVFALVAAVALPALAAAQTPGSPTGLVASVSGSVVTLSWAVPSTGGVVAGYAIDAGSVAGATLASNFVVGNVLTIVGPLLPAGSYFARVRAFNASGPGPASSDVSFTIGGASAAPGPPTTLAGSVSGNVVAITWGPATSGGPATSYVVDAGTASGTSDVANGLPVGTALSAQGTLPAGRYFVRVRGVNAAGPGAPSNEVVLQVGGTTGTGAPGAPRGLHFTVLGTAVALDWAAPATGGAPSSYRVELGSTPGASDLTTVNVGGATGGTGSLPAGTYFARVRALNATGPGAASNELAITTSAAACQGPIIATLTWDVGAAPNAPAGTPLSDIDLHIIEPNGDKVYWNTPGARGETLSFDLDNNGDSDDNVDGFGPEHICSYAPPAAGTYQVYVVAFSGDVWPATARVVVRTNVGTANEQVRAFTRTFTGADITLGYNVATVTYPGGAITETAGTRVADAADVEGRDAAVVVKARRR